MILVIRGQMMVLETLLNVKLALLHSEVDRVNLPLHRTHTSLKRIWAKPASYCGGGGAVWEEDALVGIAEELSEKRTLQ
jgi:hypothetical protein